jgi:site-specific DNA-methyltransferase (adenine-specific)
MEYMRTQPDNAFDLAICDPMYILPERYLCPGNKDAPKGIKRRHTEQARELAKTQPIGNAYYDELCRISTNQIIWGINYFEFAGRVPGRIIWDKKNDTSTFSHAELASCSLHLGTRIFRYLWNGMLQENMKNKEVRIHPFQKPVSLYSWILKKYAEPGQRVFDSHLGSGSSAIAAHYFGVDFVGTEIDKTHFENGRNRFNHETKQIDIFQGAQ